MGLPPVETIGVVAERPSQPAARHNATANAEASTRRSGQATTPRSASGVSGAWPPHVARRPRERPVAQRSRQLPAQRTAPPPGAPVAPRYTATRSKPHRRVPTGCLRARPTPPRLASPRGRRIAHGRSRARAAKAFPTGTGRPSEDSGASAFRLHPLRRRLPAGAIRPARRAKGRAPTRGGRRPWERASTRGRTRRSART